VKVLQRKDQLFNKEKHLERSDVMDSKVSGTKTWRKVTGVVAGMLLVGLLASACSSSSSSNSSSKPATSSAKSSASSSSTSSTSGSTATTTSQNVTLQVLTGKMDGKPGWPKFTPADFTVHKGETVVLTIKSFDDGTAPLPAGSPYSAVEGGTETVDGQAVTSIPDNEISHTFSIPELGINVPIPAVTSTNAAAGSQPPYVEVVFTFTPTKSGSFMWMCMAPCGSGPTGMGGAMVTMGWMRGTMTVA